MKAPDKIYCENCSDGIYSHIHRWENADNIEYIRKDALLEWAKDWQDELDDSLGASMVHHVLNEVIKKIESL